MRQEQEAIKTEIGIARLVTGTVLGAVLAAGVLLGNALAAMPAAADEALKLWNDRSKMVEELAKNYAEAPRALGITSDGAVVELFTTNDGDTWTLMVTLPNGLSRVIATGEHWLDRPMLAKGQMS